MPGAPSSLTAAATSGAGDEAIGVNDGTAEVRAAAVANDGPVATPLGPTAGPAQHTRSLPARWSEGATERGPPALAASACANDGPASIATTLCDDDGPAGIPATADNSGPTSDAVTAVRIDWQDCVLGAGAAAASAMRRPRSVLGG